MDVRARATEERPYHHGHLRAALLDAAERGLREHGADQLSLRDLAREIGVSHAAPRRHFPDRQALLDALAEVGFARLDATLRTALAGTNEDFPSRVRATMTAYIRFATENAALLELMYTSKHRPGATRIVKAAEAPFGLMHELILQGQAQGALQARRPRADRDRPVRDPAGHRLDHQRQHRQTGTPRRTRGDRRRAVPARRPPNFLAHTVIAPSNSSHGGSWVDARGDIDDASLVCWVTCQPKLSTPPARCRSSRTWWRRSSRPERPR